MRSSVQLFFRMTLNSPRLLLAFGLALPAVAQDRAATLTFHDGAEITHNGQTVRTSASNARPLDQTVSAVDEEYGWHVDYEDPVYDSNTETTDQADAAWRNLHPNETRIMIPNGSAYQAEYAEVQGKGGKINQLQVVQTIIAAYNQSSNPGYFFLDEEPGGVSVVGVSRSHGIAQESQKEAFLSTKISLPITQRTLDATLDVVLSAVTEKTGIKAVIGSGPTPQFMQKVVTTVGGNDVIARDLLRQSLDQSGRTWLWSLLYEPTYHTYYLNVLPAMVATFDARGWRHLISVDPPPVHPR